MSSTSVLPHIDTVISRDSLLDTLKYQLEYNPENKDIYDKRWRESPGYLNQELRLELASRYAASGDKGYKPLTLRNPRYNGETHLFYPGDGQTKIRVSSGLIDILKINK